MYTLQLDQISCGPVSISNAWSFVNQKRFPRQRFQAIKEMCHMKFHTDGWIGTRIKNFESVMDDVGLKYSRIEGKRALQIILHPKDNDPKECIALWQNPFHYEFQLRIGENWHATGLKQKGYPYKEDASVGTLKQDGITYSLPIVWLMTSTVQAETHET